MGKEILHAIDIKKIISVAIIGFIFGSVLALVPASYIVSLAIIIIGLLLVVTNGITVYHKMSNHEKSSNELLLEIIGILGGFLLIVSPNLVFVVLVSIYLMVPSAINVYKSKFDKNTILDELPYFILGLLLILCAIGTLDKLFQAVGIILIIISLVYGGYNYYLYKKSGVKIIK